MPLKNEPFTAMVAAMNTTGTPWPSAALFGLALALPMLAPTEAAAQEGKPATPGIGRVEKTLDGEREIRDRVEAFFVTIEGGNTSTAFASLMEGSPMGKDPQVVESFVAKTNDIVGEFGAITSHELLEIKRVGARLMRFTYLSYSDDYPLKWEIYCFLGKSGWRLLDFSVNKNLEELFDGTLAP